jgi:hypothetical protein
MKPLFSLQWWSSKRNEKLGNLQSRRSHKEEKKGEGEGIVNLAMATEA